VFFLAVLYHLRHPLLALERVAAVTGDLLFLETEVDLALGRRPAMAFYALSEPRRDALAHAQQGRITVHARR